jgi:hypothetical protein
MFNISKFPVLIISNYRTGSSALSDWIGRNYTIPSIGEPIHWPDKMLALTSMIKNNNLQFCCKFHIDQIQPGDIHSQLLEMNSYKIKITRNDLVAQITSYYIASVRNIWKQDTANIPTYVLPVDLELISRLTKIIIDNNEKLNNSNIDFDLEIRHEDLNFTLPLRFKTTPPANINEITSAVTLSINNVLTLLR